jgi:hypothetical protein
MIIHKYSFKKLPQNTQGINVLDATASNMRGGFFAEMQMFLHLS